MRGLVVDVPLGCLTEAEDHVSDPGGEKAQKPKPRDYGQHPHLPVTVLRPPPWKVGGRGGAADEAASSVSRQGLPYQGPSGVLQRCISSVALFGLALLL